MFLDTSTAESASIANNGPGSLFFADTSTAGNASITNNAGGFLQFSNTSTAGSAAITNNADLQFFDTSTAGSAAITNGASAPTDFSGSSGPNGDHKLSAGSLAGGGTFFLGQNELTVGSNNLSTTVTGVIADGGLGGGVGGSLVKIGTGTLALSGANTYTGATTVNGGLLEIDGSIAQSGGVTVNSGGALGGTGTVSSTMIASGGTLAPGQSIGTLSVNGNLTFNSGAVYAVDVSPAAADRTNVTGTATLAGTVAAAFQAGSYVAKDYTILSAASRNGTFNTLTTSNLPNGFGASLLYSGGDVLLDLALTNVTASGLTRNQQAVANAINTAFNNGSALPPGFVTLVGLSGPQLSNALDQVSGESGASITQAAFDASNQFMNLLLDPFNVSRNAEGGASAFTDQTLGYAANRNHDAKAADAYAAMTPRDKAPSSRERFGARWNVWASGYGGSSSVSGDASTGSHSTTSRIYGTAVGADYLLSPKTIAGFALAGGGTNFSVVNSGSGRSDLFQAGAFIRHNAGAA